MLAEVRLLISPREVRLVLKRGDDVVEDELWKFETKCSATEARELCQVVFDDCYDLLNFSVHGDQ